MSDLVALPEHGRVFTLSRRGRLGDTTTSGRVRMDTLARWLQDAAYDDVIDAGLASEGAWVVRRTRLLVRRFPRFDEPVDVRTFSSGIGARWGQRRTVMRGAAGAEVEGDALWILIDPDTMRPMRVGEAFAAVYGEAAGGRRAARARLHHPSPPDDAPSEEWHFRASDLDIVGHVNNAAYWEVLEERLSHEPEPASLDAEVEYRDAAPPGPARVVRRDGVLWVTSLAGVVHASIARRAT